jgi:hypothetical protein
VKQFLALILLAFLAVLGVKLAIFPRFPLPEMSLFGAKLLD